MPASRRARASTFKRRLRGCAKAGQDMSMGRSMARPWLALGLVVASTTLGLMGTDLVLPAVPYLPDLLGGTAAGAQLVLAAYVAGTCVGLLVYGALGDRMATVTLFVASLLA